MDEPDPEPKLTPKQRELISLAIEVTLLIVAIGVSSYLWTKKHATHTVTTKTVVVSGQPQPAASTTASPTPSLPTGTMETVTLPIDSVAAGYKLSLQVPRIWRTVDVRTLVPLSSYSTYNGNDLAAILRFVPEQPERKPLYPATEPVNRLDVLATGRWMNEDESDPATAANKKLYLGYLSALKSVDDIDGKKCTAISFGGFICTDLKVKPQIIHSVDGSLSGLAYMGMQMQSVSYDPSVRIEMVGTVNGKPLHVSGSFSIYDKLFETLGGGGAQSNPAASDYISRVTAARKAYLDGNPPADAVDAYNRILAAVQSMKIAK